MSVPPLSALRPRGLVPALFLTGLLCLAAPLPSTQAQAAPPAAQEKTVSLDVTAADLHAVMSMLERQADVKSSIHDGNPPYKPIYVHLENVSLTKALRAIAASAGASVSLNANGVYVFEPGGTTTIVPPPSAPAEKPAPKTKAPLNPADLHWQKLVLQHTTPDEVMRIMHWNDATGTLPDGVITIYGLHSDNSLLIEATPEGVNKVRQIVKNLDVAKAQTFVRLKVTFVVPTARDSDVVGMNFESGKTATDLLATLAGRGDQVIAAPPMTIGGSTNPAYIDLPQISQTTLADAQANQYNGPAPSLTIMARLNSDNTITLGVQSTPTFGDAPPQLNTLRTVKSGETMVLAYPSLRKQLPQTPTLDNGPVITPVFPSQKMPRLLVFLTPSLADSEKIAPSSGATEKQNRIEFTGP